MLIMICGVHPPLMRVFPVPEGGQGTARSPVMLGSTQGLCKWAVPLASELAAALGSMQMWFSHQQAVVLPPHLHWVL